MPPDTNLDAIRKKRVPITWAYTGPMSFQSRHHTISGSSSCCIDLNKGLARGTLWQPSVRDEVVEKGLDGTVILPHGLARHSYVSVGGLNRQRYFNVIIQELNVDLLSGRPHITRETILGLTLADDPEWNSVRFQTVAFGRKMLICGYATRGRSAETDSTQIVYHGAPLSGNKRFAIHDLLRFLGGTRGNSTFCEIFDARGRRIRLTFRGRGVASPQQGIRPVDLQYVSSRPALAQIANDFGAMAEQMLDLRRKNSVRLAAVMHHYNEGAVSTYPTSRLRNLSVAVEALAGLLLNRSPKPSFIINNTVFCGLIKPVDATFLAEFPLSKISPFVSPSWTPTDALKELRKRIISINRQGPSIEVIRTLNDLGVHVKPIENKTLKECRNRVLHDGHRGDETLMRTLDQNRRAAAIIANLFNRSMLRLLRYQGNYLDAYSRRKSLPLNQIPRIQRLTKP